MPSQLPLPRNLALGVLATLAGLAGVSCGGTQVSDTLPSSTTRPSAPNAAPMDTPTQPSSPLSEAERSAAAKTSSPSASAPDESVAVLAGGCFWGMEDILRKHKGVRETQVGYTGGQLANPTYPDMRTGKTGHAEAIRIAFNADQVSYGELLDMFFRMHDPTTKNRQGNDVGSQYRSAIFYADEQQKAEANAAIARAQASGRWNRPIATEVVAAGVFWPAEDYHQDYLEKNPGGYSCHWVRD